MIVGVGLDIASIERVARALGRHGARFEHRILTSAERGDIEGRRDRAHAVAARFAAKEAAFKALGGPRDVSWHQIELRREPGGAPRVELAGAARGHAARRGVTAIHVSLTHDAGLAAAVVILEKCP
jgi:holo-[acyl-carrier protein] synthase